MKKDVTKAISEDFLKTAHQASHMLGEVLTSFIARLEDKGQEINPLVSLWAFENEAALLRRFLVENGVPQVVLDDIRSEAEACAVEHKPAYASGRKS